MIWVGVFEVMAKGEDTYKYPEGENIGNDDDKKRSRNILGNLPKRVAQSFEAGYLQGPVLLKQSEFRESHCVNENDGCPSCDRDLPLNLRLPTDGPI